MHNSPVVSGFERENSNLATEYTKDSPLLDGLIKSSDFMGGFNMKSPTKRNCHVVKI